MDAPVPGKKILLEGPPNHEWSLYFDGASKAQEWQGLQSSSRVKVMNDESKQTLAGARITWLNQQQRGIELHS